MFEAFYSALDTTLRNLARDPVVVGFKTVVGYRTGLDINVNHSDLSGIERGIIATISSWKKKAGEPDVLRLAEKALNDFVVCTALSIAMEFNKPGKHSLTLIQDHSTSEWNGLSSSSISHWSW